MSRSATRVAPGRHGFTLVEILTATVLTMVMMIGVVTVLGTVTTSLKQSRSGLEMMDRLRSAQRTLRRDLEWATVPMLRMWMHQHGAEANIGYFEYIEGPIGPVIKIEDYAVNSDTGEADTSVGDTDDILMFTARSPGSPYVGRAESLPGGTLQCPDAEIAYFVRGRTLYRRVLLVPSDNILRELDIDGDRDIDTDDSTLSSSFFNEYDISAHPAAFNTTSLTNETSWVPNSLADLANRENRFAHCLHYEERVPDATYGFPFDARRWRQLGLPTLQECSHLDWMRWSDAAAAPVPAPDGSDDVSTMDFWTNPNPLTGVNPTTGIMTAYEGPRVGEDVLLTNVIGFDVKAWDPGAPVFQHASGVTLMPGDPGYPAELVAATAPIGYGAYVDLNYNNGVSSPHLANSHFAGVGEDGSQLNPASGPFTYDTWSLHYENDGINQDNDTYPNPNPPPDTLPLIDEGTNGFDDDGVNGVDDPDELETSPPYPHPLRAIQIKIRVFEPDSRQVREVTVVQDFLPR